jgi:hypothetical protein
MDLRFTELQEMMRLMARNFADKEIAPYTGGWDKYEFPRQPLGKCVNWG